MKLHKYLTPSGEFDYRQYVGVQEAGNLRKLESVWANEEVISRLSAFLVANCVNLRFGLCHGTRRGLEQKWFAEKTGAAFLGTEISSSAIEFPNTIQWDFHEVKPEWIGAVDAISSNSWDHAYEPKKCFRAWMK